MFGNSYIPTFPPIPKKKKEKEKGVFKFNFWLFVSLYEPILPLSMFHAHGLGL